MYEDGAEALIEFEGQQRRVNAQSRQRKCAEFARFSNLNAGTLHTIRISVTGGGGRAVFPLIALECVRFALEHVQLTDSLLLVTFCLSLQLSPLFTVPLSASGSHSRVSLMASARLHTR